MQSTTRLSPAEFKAYYASSWWLNKRREALDYYGHECAVCGLDYKERTKVGRFWRSLRWLYRLFGATFKDRNYLTVHHLYYVKNGQPIFHRETMEDLAVLCWHHHPRGSLSRGALRRWAASYAFWKMVRSLFRRLPLSEAW
jgi:hypothetical protein